MEIPQYLLSHQAITLYSLLALALVLFIAKRIIMVRLTEKARSDTSNMFNIYRALVLALDAPMSFCIVIIFVVIGRSLLVWFEALPDSGARLFDHIIKALIVIALFFFLERFFIYSIRLYQKRSVLVKNSSGIASGAIRVILASLAVLIVLSTMGISVTPIIASLGITSLAVALALQPTLENFFSGLQLVIDKPVRIGDYIELDSGEQGFVEKIGWRSTWIKMLPNNIVIMPNSKLSNSKLINYFYPEKELSVPVDLGVHYSSDLEKVEKICVETAREILNTHEYGVPSYEPFAIFHTFDNSSINLTVMLRTKEYFNRFFIKSAFIKLLKKRFDEEGIVIPFPITAVNMDQEGATSHMTNINAGKKSQQTPDG